MSSGRSFQLVDAGFTAHFKLCAWQGKVGGDKAAGLRTKGARRFSSKQQGLLAQYLSSQIRTAEQARAAAIAGRIPGTQHEIAKAATTKPVAQDPDVIETAPLDGDAPMRFIRDEASKFWKAAPADTPIGPAAPKP